MHAGKINDSAFNTRLKVPEQAGTGCEPGLVVPRAYRPQRGRGHVTGTWQTSNP